MYRRELMTAKQLTVDKILDDVYRVGRTDATLVKSDDDYPTLKPGIVAALSKLVEEVVIGADLVCDIKVDHIKPGDSHGFCFRHGEVAAINKEKALMRERARKAGFSV
jgi:hypothetical protein